MDGAIAPVRPFFRDGRSPTQIPRPRARCRFLRPHIPLCMIPASPPLESDPINPGLPAARNFPFQFAATGSHTSMPIWESLVGAENASILQKGTLIFLAGMFIMTD